MVIIIQNHLDLSFRSAVVSREESAVSLPGADSSPIKSARNDKGRVCVHRSSPELASQRPPLPLPPRQQRQLTPLPTSIDIDEADLAEPYQLGFHLEQFVGRVFRLRRPTNAAQKLVVKFCVGELHAPGCKDTARAEHAIYLP